VLYKAVPFVSVYINELIGILENHGIRDKVFADEVKINFKIVNDVDCFQLQCGL